MRTAEVELTASSGRLFSAIEIFREYDPKAPSSLLVTFLAVASRPGISQAEIGELTGQQQSTVATTVAQLSDRGDAGKALNFIEITPDPTNARRKELRLTPRGRKVATRMAEALR